MINVCILLLAIWPIWVVLMVASFLKKGSWLSFAFCVPMVMTLIGIWLNGWIPFLGTYIMLFIQVILWLLLICVLVYEHRPKENKEKNFADVADRHD